MAGSFEEDAAMTQDLFGGFDDELEEHLFGAIAEETTSPIPPPVGETDTDLHLDPIFFPAAMTLPVRYRYVAPKQSSQGENRAASPQELQSQGNAQ